MTTYLVLAGILIFLALLALWGSARQRKASGLPGGRVVAADTGAWRKLERPLYDPETGLTGRPDYILERNGVWVPVEVKSGWAPPEPRHHHLPGRTMATTNDLKNGLVLNIDGQLWTVVEFQHVKPGKGPAFVRTKLKNVLSGKVVDKTFNAGLKVETANVDKRDMTYLYKDGTDFVFMDLQSYDQLHISGDVVGDAEKYLLENQNALVATNEGVPLYVELPASVELEITYTEPGLQGDRSTGGTKPATLETGAEIQVPLFVEQGTKVKVDTRDGSYLGRVN